MKVLKSGSGQKGWSKKFKCTGVGNGGGGCGAELLVEQGDVFETSRSSMGEVDRFATFECCECGVLTDIPSVPFEIHPRKKQTSPGPWD